MVTNSRVCRFALQETLNNFQITKTLKKDTEFYLYKIIFDFEVLKIYLNIFFPILLQKEHQDQQ